MTSRDIEAAIRRSQRLRKEAEKLKGQIKDEMEKTKNEALRGAYEALLGEEVNTKASTEDAEEEAGES